jgi:hypothetical protein
LDLLYNIRCNIEIELKKKFYGSVNDPPLPRIPKGPIFEAWKSFSVVSFEVNCFGFGNWEDLLDYTTDFVQPFYSEYCKMEKRVRRDNDIYDNGRRRNDNYKWTDSSFWDDIMKKMWYRGWVKNYIEYAIQCDEALKLLKEIEMKVNQDVKYEYEPWVPNCRTVCGIFVINIPEFIQGTIRKAVHLCHKEEDVRNMFDEFARSTIERIVKSVLGPLEDEENVIRILVDIEIRELIRHKMKEEESQLREMQLIDAWHIKNYTIKEFL